MPRFSIIVAAILLALATAGAAAQPATPVAGECTIEPRTNEEISELARLAATPAADTSFQGSVRLPDGEPLDAETLDQLVATLDEADACAKARDLQRFLALYTDRFIVESIFAAEPSGVTAGSQPPGQAPPAASPIPEPVNVIDDAVLLEDGRVAAHVFVTGSTDFGSIVWFALVDGRWRIDEIRPSANPPAGTTTVPAGAEGIVERAIEDAAAALGVSPEAISLVSIKAVDWPDSALGCPEEGGVYAPAITSGYSIILTDGETTLIYHTDTAGTVIRCEPD